MYIVRVRIRQRAEKTAEMLDRNADAKMFSKIIVKFLLYGLALEQIPFTNTKLAKTLDTLRHAIDKWDLPMGSLGEYRNIYVGHDLGTMLRQNAKRKKTTINEEFTNLLERSIKYRSMAATIYALNSVGRNYPIEVVRNTLSDLYDLGITDPIGDFKNYVEIFHKIDYTVDPNSDVSDFFLSKNKKVLGVATPQQKRRTKSHSKGVSS